MRAHLGSLCSFPKFHSLASSALCMPRPPSFEIMRPCSSSPGNSLAAKGKQGIALYGGTVLYLTHLFLSLCSVPIAQSKQAFISYPEYSIPSRYISPALPGRRRRRPNNKIRREWNLLRGGFHLLLLPHGENPPSSNVDRITRQKYEVRV